nr:hypothetical protein [Pedobacter sp. ASV2]
MKNENNKNLEDKELENNADRSNMPDHQVPRHRSNYNESKNKVKSEAGNLARDFGKGDFGSEEARSDAGKGNKGHAGNMPNTEEK